MLHALANMKKLASSLSEVLNTIGLLGTQLPELYFDLHSDASSELEAFSGAPHLRESALSSQIVRFVKFCLLRWLRLAVKAGI